MCVDIDLKRPLDRPSHCRVCRLLSRSPWTRRWPSINYYTLSPLCLFREHTHIMHKLLCYTHTHTHTHRACTDTHAQALTRHTPGTCTHYLTSLLLSKHSWRSTNKKNTKHAHTPILLNITFSYKRASHLK